MRLIHLTVVFALLTLSSSLTHAFLSANAKITIKVVDETGVPVEGARVGAGFKTVRSSQGTVSTNVVKITNHDGLFEGKESSDGHIGWNIKKTGYYETRGAYDFNNETAFRWEPWNPVITTVLRKIENPVPMYIRNTKKYKLEIPEVDKNIGFDFIKSDWVAPYGQGEKADLIFHLKRHFVKWNDQDCTLTLTFSNKHDGIQYVEENPKSGSIFKLPRYAPESGYVNKKVFYIRATGGTWKSNIQKNDNYIFRIRTKEKDGKVAQATYGKIIGALDFSPIGSKSAIIVMKYYLNPDGTRNLEHDTRKNLFNE